MAPRHLSSHLMGLESWLKAQVPGHLGHFWVKTDQRPTALTAGEMECISKVHPLPMPFQCSHHLLFLLQMDVADGQEPYRILYRCTTCRTLTRRIDQLIAAS